MSEIIYPPVEEVACKGCGVVFLPDPAQWLKLCRGERDGLFHTVPCYNLWRKKQGAIKRAEREADPAYQEKRKAAARLACERWRKANAEKCREANRRWRSKESTQLKAKKQAEKKAREIEAAKKQKALRKQIEDLRAQAQASKAKHVKIVALGPEHPLTPPRKCHDCGAETTDYRCEDCGRRWKAKHRVYSGNISAEEYGGCSMSAGGGINR